MTRFVESTDGRSWGCQDIVFFILTNDALVANCAMSRDKVKMVLMAWEPVVRRTRPKRRVMKFPK